MEKLQELDDMYDRYLSRITDIRYLEYVKFRSIFGRNNNLKQMNSMYTRVLPLSGEKRQNAGSVRYIANSDILPEKPYNKAIRKSETHHDESLISLLKQFATSINETYKVCTVCGLPFVTAPYFRKDICITCYNSAGPKRSAKSRIYLTCKQCRGKFVKTEDTTDRFCSPACKSKYMSNLVPLKTVTCPVCKNQFRSRSPRQICCSKHCKQIHGS